MNQDALKIAVVTSGRADWGLLHPLVSELSSRGVKLLIIATYAHLFPEMGDTISELVEDGFPPTMSVPARRPRQEAVADAVTGFSMAFRYLRPDVAVVLGDRFEILGVATAAVLERTPLAHIAGGTVSEGAFDDAFRNAISQMATIHFPETDKARRRLITAGADPRLTRTAGALGVYNALNTPLIPLKELESSLDFELGDKYLLGTFHPATLSKLEPIPQMKIWIAGLEKALDRHPDLKLLLTFPNTDNEPTSLLNLLFTLAASRRGRVKVVPSLGRVRYLSAAKHAAVVAGNSSSGIVEVPSLGVPVVDVGIRQQGRERAKSIIHTDLDVESIADGISLALTPEMREEASRAVNPYFKADTPSLMADFLISEAEKLKKSR